MMNVQEQIVNALHWDFALPRDRLSVKCEGGWVTLSGEVDRDYQRTCAEADALRVPGVAGVKNEISVRGRKDQTY